VLPGFHARGCYALADLIVETLGIKARDCCDFQIAKQRLYVALDAPSIGRQRRRLLSEPSTSKNAPGLAGLKVIIAQFRYRLSLAALLLLFGGVGALRNFAEDAASFGPCQVWCPGCAVATDCVPALAANGRSVFQYIGDGFAFLAACTETGNSALTFVPHRLTRRNRGY
jgi:hypothetical protein